MNITSGQLVLLDTCVIVHLARRNATGVLIEEQFRLSEGPDKPLLSTIVEGELRGLAKYLQWGHKKLSVLEEIFREMVRIDPSYHEVIQAYAELYAEGRTKGLPSKQNDLWIAATAKATGAVLITCDRDFDWMHGAHIQRIYVPEVNNASPGA